MLEKIIIKSAQVYETLIGNVLKTISTIKKVKGQICCMKSNVQSRKKINTIMMDEQCILNGNEKLSKNVCRGNKVTYYS